MNYVHQSFVHCLVMQVIIVCSITAKQPIVYILEWQIFSAFLLAAISAFSPSVASDFLALFVSFEASFRCHLSLFLALFAVFLHQRHLPFCSFILVKVVFYFLEIYLEIFLDFCSF